MREFSYNQCSEVSTSDQVISRETKGCIEKNEMNLIMNVERNIRNGSEITLGLKGDLSQMVLSSDTSLTQIYPVTSRL